MSRKQFEPFVRWVDEDGMLTERARGYLQGVPSSQVSAAVSGSAGGTYTSAEQAMLNELKTLVNELRAALIANGTVV